ncbi:MAG TPA: hypothetical protein V6D15_07450 [Oculatellaceae cyanobacterium]|jgi:hypothetical protein
MNLKLLALVGTFLVTGITTAYAEVSPTQRKPISHCQKVNYPIGLTIRSAPSSSSRRIGSVGYGQKVRLAGTLTKARTGSFTVVPTTAKDENGTTWVKIKAPIRGFVLFATGSDRDSLISCQQ